MRGSSYVICLCNPGYEASLERGARYRLLPDAEAAKHRQVRVVDESGEDYLYPESWFFQDGAGGSSVSHLKPGDGGSTRASFRGQVGLDPQPGWWFWPVSGW